jgi:hypothetical protein
MRVEDLRELLDRQSGVLCRSQVLQAGGRPFDIERWLRRNEVRRILPGVYVSHTGPPDWLQRAWAAVLWARPAALGWTAAVLAAGGRPAPLPGESAVNQPIHLLVGRGRNLIAPPGITLHHCQALSACVLWAASPPRQRIEDAALDIAVAHLAGSGANAHLDAVAALAEPIQAHRTTVERMLAALERRRRIPHRAWLAGVIRDVGAGATSVLEQGYLRWVERPHGLPRAGMQVAAEALSGRVSRDAVYLGRRVVELDGRMFHAGAGRRDQDLERDLDAALAGLDTTRLGWGQVFDRPCVTAGKVAALLTRLGWSGSPRACRTGCPAPTVFRHALAA